jgi:hypothetical protein
VDLGHNLGAASSTPAALQLQTLRDNGGPTQTIAIGSNSSTIGMGDPDLNGTTDQRGVTRPQQMGPAPQPDIGSYEAQPQQVSSVQVNDGSAQRSEVRSISVTFSAPMTFVGGNDNAAGAFQLRNVNDGNLAGLATAVSTNSLGNTVVTLTFSGSETDPLSGSNGGQLSLVDGRYQLTILSASISNSDGSKFSGDGPNGNYVSPTDTIGGGPGQLHLYRLFGDATGNGFVDAQDLGQLRATNHASTGNPLYLSYLDADNSGTIDTQDVNAFSVRYNGNVF